MLLLLFIALLPILIILEVAEKSQDPCRVLFFYDYILIRQAQQNQQAAGSRMQDAGSENQAQQNQQQNQQQDQTHQRTSSRGSAAGDLQQGSRFRGPGSGPGDQTHQRTNGERDLPSKVTLLFFCKSYIKVGRKLHAKVTCESYIGFVMKVTYESWR